MWLFIAIALAGFWLLCIKQDIGISSGDLLVFFGAIFFAVHITVIDFFNEKNTDGVLMSCIQFFTAGLLMLICMFIFEKPAVSNIVGAGGTILYAGIMSCGVAYTLQIIGQKNMNPTVASLILSLESCISVLAGWILLGQKLSVKEIIGCIIMFCAIVLAQLPQKNPKEA